MRRRRRRQRRLLRRRRRRGNTALLVACGKGHVAVVTKLLAARADVNQPLSDGCTPLSIACQEGHAEVAATLLAANAEVDQACEDGATPMAIACHHGHLGCVQILSSYGARRAFSLPGGIELAELVATSEGHHDIVSWLARSRYWSALHHLKFLTPSRLGDLAPPARPFDILITTKAQPRRLQDIFGALRAHTTAASRSCGWRVGEAGGQGLRHGINH